MPDFKRRRGESAKAWSARLGKVNRTILSARQLDELTLHRVQAGRALRREARGRRKAASLAEEAGDGLDSETLRRCKEAVRALSVEDRRRLLRWVETTFDD